MINKWSESWGEYGAWVFDDSRCGLRFDVIVVDPRVEALFWYILHADELKQGLRSQSTDSNPWMHQPANLSLHSLLVLLDWSGFTADCCGVIRSRDEHQRKIQSVFFAIVLESRRGSHPGIRAWTTDRFNVDALVIPDVKRYKQFLPDEYQFLYLSCSPTHRTAR